MFAFQHCWTEYEVFAQLSTHNLPVVQSNQCHLFPWTTTHAVSTVAAKRISHLWIWRIKMMQLLYLLCTLEGCSAVEMATSISKLGLTWALVKMNIFGLPTVDIWKTNENQNVGTLEECVQSKKKILFSVIQMHSTKQGLCYKLWSSQENLNNLWLVPFAVFFLYLATYGEISLNYSSRNQLLSPWLKKTVCWPSWVNKKRWWYKFKKNKKNSQMAVDINANLEKLWQFQCHFNWQSWSWQKKQHVVIVGQHELF